MADKEGTKRINSRPDSPRQLVGDGCDWKRGLGISEKQIRFDMIEGHNQKLFARHATKLAEANPTVVDLRNEVLNPQ